MRKSVRERKGKVKDIRHEEEMRERKGKEGNEKGGRKNGRRGKRKRINGRKERKWERMCEGKNRARRDEKRGKVKKKRENGSY